MSPSLQIADRFVIADPGRDLLGRGGMGEVYRATDTHTGELVALKALDPHVVAGDPCLLERFTRVAHLLSERLAATTRTLEAVLRQTQSIFPVIASEAKQSPSGEFTALSSPPRISATDFATALTTQIRSLTFPFPCVILFVIGNDSYVH